MKSSQRRSSRPTIHIWIILAATGKNIEAFDLRNIVAFTQKICNDTISIGVAAGGPGGRDRPEDKGTTHHSGHRGPVKEINKDPPHGLDNVKSVDYDEQWRQTCTLS